MSRYLKVKPAQPEPVPYGGIPWWGGRLRLKSWIRRLGPNNSGQGYPLDCYGEPVVFPGVRSAEED